MKKLWNARKDSEGVSPVIATILMVAITVVLAAILMVMVMGMTGGTDVTAQISKYDSTKLQVTSASTIMAQSDVHIFVDPDGEAPNAEMTGSWNTAGSVLSGSVFTPGTAFATDDVITLVYQGTVIATLTW